jgi:hypothetical protein
LDFLTVEHRESFIAAGFADVVIHTKTTKGWICRIARKPVAMETGERLILL